MELWELTARESIRDLVARYNANGDTGRFDQLLELFAPDAVMETSDETGAKDVKRGREQIRTIFTGAAGRFGAIPNFTYLRHSTTTLQIDLIDQTHAKSRCYFSVLMDHGLDHWGRYIDEFKVVDGKWLFSSRKVTTDRQTEGHSRSRKAK